MARYPDNGPRVFFHGVHAVPTAPNVRRRQHFCELCLPYHLVNVSIPTSSINKMCTRLSATQLQRLRRAALSVPAAIAPNGVSPRLLCHSRHRLLLPSFLGPPLAFTNGLAGPAADAYG